MDGTRNGMVQWKVLFRSNSPRQLPGFRALALSMKQKGLRREGPQVRLDPRIRQLLQPLTTSYGIS